MKKKTCRNCNREKREEEFQKHNRVCKKCVSEKRDRKSSKAHKLEMEFYKMWIG